MYVQLLFMGGIKTRGCVKSWAEELNNMFDASLDYIE